MSQRKLFYLTVLVLVCGLGYIGGWLVFFLALMTAVGVYLGGIIIWRRNLPIATVNVDGHEIKFKYVRVHIGENRFIYKNIETSVEDDRNNVWLVVMRLAEMPYLEPLDLEGVTFPAKLALENANFSFLMDSRVIRCPCGSVPPCWIGKEYSSTFMESRGALTWGAVLCLVKIDNTYGHRMRKHKPKEEKDFSTGMEPVFT